MSPVPGVRWILLGILVFGLLEEAILLAGSDRACRPSDSLPGIVGKRAQAGSDNRPAQSMTFLPL
jgi:hypothetical protein